jgi:hypothetical protein
MRIINNLPLKLTIVLMIISLVKAAGQPVTDAFLCSREMNHLKMMVKDTTHTSFQGEYVIIFNDATKDSVHYQFRISKNRIHREASDSTEIIQNNMYNLTVHHDQDRAVISRPVDVFRYISNVNITDASFYQSLVSGMTITDTGSYRKFSLSFKAASPYRSYDIIYDPANYRIQAIQYSFNISGSTTSGSSRMPFRATITFSNYQTGSFTDSAFSTNRYFIRKQGICNMVAPYTSYQLINSLNQ